MKELSRFEKIVIYTLVAVLIAALALLGVNIALRSVSKNAGADGEEEEAGMYISNAVSTDAAEIVVEEIPAAADEVQPVIEEIPVEEIAAEPVEEVPAEEIAAELIEEVPADEIVAEPVEEIPAEEIVDEPVEENPAEEITEEPVEEIPTEEIPAELAEEIPAEEITEEPVEEIPAEEITVEPAEKTTKEIPAEEITVVPAEETAEADPAEEVLIDTSDMREVQLIAFKGETTVLVYRAPDEDAEVLDWFDSGIWVYLEDHDDEWSTVILDNVRCYVKNGNVLFYGVENITEEEQRIFRSVSISVDMHGASRARTGLLVTLTAVLEGFENDNYEIQWMYAEEGSSDLHVISGANDINYSYHVSSENRGYTWYVQVTFTDAASENVD